MHRPNVVIDCWRRQVLAVGHCKGRTWQRVGREAGGERGEANENIRNGGGVGASSVMRFDSKWVLRVLVFLSTAREERLLLLVAGQGGSWVRERRRVSEGNTAATH